MNDSNIYMYIYSIVNKLMTVYLIDKWLEKWIDK